MSRIGRKPIEIPAGVKVDVSGSKVTVEGPKGTLNMKVRPEIEVSVEDSTIKTGIKIETKKSNAYWGLTSSLLSNMIEGVTEGYEKTLELVGVGYRVESKGPSKISLTLGYSHPVGYEAPEGVALDVPDNKTILVKGNDKQLVGLAASNIRKLRKPEPYKGKGIKYSDEVIKRKAGKSAVI
jgi:large subunit ribosomal protein L6